MLRLAVGWPVPDEDVVTKAMANRVYGVVAILAGKMIGMASVVGDGLLINYVQDVIVHPEHQKKGVGDLLMQAVMSYLHAHAIGNSDVALICAPGKEGFYQRYGFNVFTPDKPGMRTKTRRPAGA